MIGVVGRVTENDEYGTGGVKIQLHGGATVGRVPDGRRLNHAGIGMPQLGYFAGHAEGAFGGIKLPPLVGNKIDIRCAGDAMHIQQPRIFSRAGKFKIRRQFLRGENVGQRSAPNDAAFAIGIFENTAAVTWTPQFVGKRLHLRVAARKAREAW